MVENMFCMQGVLLCAALMLGFAERIVAYSLAVGFVRMWAYLRVYCMHAHAFVSDAHHMCLQEDTWLILPVVICLSQRLSHACPSINKSIQ